MVADGLAVLCPAPLGSLVLVLGRSWFLAMDMAPVQGKQRVGVL